MAAKTVPTTPEKMLDYIMVTDTIMQKTAALVTEKEAQDKKITKLIPAAVQALLDNERIEPHQKEAAAKALKDPSKVLEILIKTAAHRNDAERAQLGKPTAQNGQVKKASGGYNSLTDPYVGRKSYPDEPESYKAFKRGLGVG